MRGGVSLLSVSGLRLVRSSPRAWGCFLGVHRRGGLGSVFPTCVGVFLTLKKWVRLRSGLPHVRGGVSSPRLHALDPLESSPRAWGCFLAHRRSLVAMAVFPTCVGVFPHFVGKGVKFERLPHVRGGVSLRVHALIVRVWSSPRAWGCFSGMSSLWTLTTVFPTCVGVFLRRILMAPSPRCLPHVRGGVS